MKVLWCMYYLSAAVSSPFRVLRHYKGIEYVQHDVVCVLSTIFRGRSQLHVRIVVRLFTESADIIVYSWFILQNNLPLKMVDGNALKCTYSVVKIDGGFVLLKEMIGSWFHSVALNATSQLNLGLKINLLVTVLNIA